MTKYITLALFDYAIKRAYKCYEASTMAFYKATEHDTLEDFHKVNMDGWYTVYVAFKGMRKNFITNIINNGRHIDTAN